MNTEKKVLTAEEFLAKYGIGKKEADDLRKKNLGLLMGSIDNVDESTKKDRPRLYFLFSKPDMSTFSLSVSRIMDRNVEAAQMSYYSNCVKWSDPQIVDGPCKDQHKFGVGKFIGTMFPIPDGQLEDF